MDLIFIRGEINERESMNSIWILEEMEKKKKRFWREDFDCTTRFVARFRERCSSLEGMQEVSISIVLRFVHKV